MAGICGDDEGVLLGYREYTMNVPDIVCSLGSVWEGCIGISAVKSMDEQKREMKLMDREATVSSYVGGS
ncbi:unnamed protein product [Cuscuta campestris]|uniref:Uncharacterized protein n=1 Tax=Cuscuta campestris TaxID=132261 RepID=A0A484N831_9ASTE|nr:unnamed protein product [Cuscuta campestris]